MPLPLKGRAGKLAYAVGNLGGTGFLQLISAWVIFFLVDVVHLAPWLAGLAYLLSYGVGNAINNIVVGSLSDRTRTRWGRRRPFIVIGIPIMFLFNILIWSPPLGGKPLAEPYSLPIFLYAVIVIAIFMFGFTMVSLPTDALFPEMYTDLKDRSEVTIYRESLAVVGGILAMVVFPLIVANLSEQFGKFGAWTWTGVIIPTIFTSAFCFALLGMRERKEFSLVDKPLPFIASFKAAITNKSWVTYKGAELMTGCLTDWISVMAPFWVVHSLGMEMSALSIMMGVEMVGMFAFFPIWRKICIRYGTKVTLAASMTTFNMGLMLALVAHDVLGTAVMGFLAGITLGGLVLSRALMWADVVDEDETKTGVRREGMYSGVAAPISQIDPIIISMSTAFLLSTIIGYVPGQPDPSFMNMGIRLGMVVFPLIFTAIMLVFLKFYPLGKKRVDEIGKEIEKMHAEKAKKLEEMKA